MNLSDIRRNSQRLAIRCNRRGKLVLPMVAKRATVMCFSELRSKFDGAAEAFLRIVSAVLRHLDRIDPEAARRARERYACFDHCDADSRVYGMLTGLRGVEGCEDEVIAMLVELRRHPADAARPDGTDRADAFDAEQNARLVKNAENYYRSMYLSNVSSWNLRDRHMVETLAALERHLGDTTGARGTRPKIVVWAHNSHLGDARATEMSSRGEINLGQLARERFGRAVFNIGFSTYDGTVTAANDWDAPTECKRVRPGLEGSYERLFHEGSGDSFWVDLADREVAHALEGPKLQRAIGVIYRPETERQSHYFQASLAKQFDALIHIDVTRAVERPRDERVESLIHGRLLLFHRRAGPALASVPRWAPRPGPPGAGRRSRPRMTRAVGL